MSNSLICVKIINCLRTQFYFFFVGGNFTSTFASSKG